MKKEIFFTLIGKIFGRSSYKEKTEEAISVRRENVWGKGGRKAQMESGVLMQLRPFTSGSKFSK